MNKKVRWGIVVGTALLILGVVNFMIHESNYSKQVEAVAKKTVEQRPGCRRNKKTN